MGLSRYFRYPGGERGPGNAGNANSPFGHRIGKAMRMTTAITAAALRHAANGRPVFPCWPDKSPRTSGGFHGATLDRRRIVGWFEGVPDALLRNPDRQGERAGRDRRGRRRGLGVAARPRTDARADAADREREDAVRRSALLLQVAGGRGPVQRREARPEPRRSRRWRLRLRRRRRRGTRWTSRRQPRRYRAGCGSCS